jgi:hypothetical protein
MPMAFDATLKELTQLFTHDYEVALRLTGPAPFRVVNVDLSTVTAATDVVFVRGDPPDAVVDVNFYAGRDPDAQATVHLYNALLYKRFRVPVHSVVVLLRPAADDAGLDAGLHYAVWPERGRSGHDVEVVRLWRQPVEQLLEGGPGILPLAPLGQLPEGTTLEEALPGILRRIHERLTQEVQPPVVAKLWMATYVLCGLRIGRHLVRPIFLGVPGMKESDTYQAILDEGRAEGIQRVLLRQGQRRLGAPGEAVKVALQGIEDLERLERMADRVHEVASWQDLLATP